MAKIDLPPSAFVKAAWHNPKTNTLTVQLGQSMYQYTGVSRQKVWRAKQEFKNGGSAGKWYNRLVKGKHPVTGKFVSPIE